MEKIVLKALDSIAKEEARVYKKSMAYVKKENEETLKDIRDSGEYRAASSAELTRMHKTFEERLKALRAAALDGLHQADILPQLSALDLPEEEQSYSGENNVRSPIELLSVRQYLRGVRKATKTVLNGILL